MRLENLRWLSICVVALTACPPPVEPPHLLYEQDAQGLGNPFPDLRLVTDQGLELRAEWYRPFLTQRSVTAKLKEFFRPYEQSAGQVRGVGNFGLTLLLTSEPIDPTSLVGTAARLRKTDEGYAVLEGEVSVTHSRAGLAGTGKEEAEGFPEFLVVRPSVTLPEGVEGMLVIKRGLKTRSGTPLGRGFEFEQEKGSADRISAAAKALGIAEEEVLLTLPLRAQVVSSPLRALADWTVSGQLPSVAIPSKGVVPDEPGTRPVGVWSSTDADWDTLKIWLEKNSFGTPADRVGKVVMGTVKSRDLRENGVWKQAWVESPGSAPAADLGFVLSLPVGPKPVGGWPVVIGGHGLGGRNTVKTGDSSSFCLEMAQLLAKSGLACLGIDATSHGSRGNQFDFFGIDDIAKGRDNFRQMTFDQLQLSRTAAVLDFDGDGTADLSSDIGYFGQSLGGIMGSSFISLDPRVRHAVLNVPGGGLSNLLAAEEIRDRLGLLIVSKTGLTFESADYYAAFPIFRAVAQLFLEAGDPINLVQGLSTEKAVLIQEGIGDRTVPNDTTEDLARAAGIEARTTPVSGSAPLQVLFRADPASYLPAAELPGYNGHGIFWSAAPVRTQAMRFLESKGTVFVVE